MAQKNPKIGLALGSGGAKGLAHIGVLKSLEKHKIPIDYIAASSIGSVIGAHYARYRNVKKLEELVLHFDRKRGVGLFDFTVIGGIMKGQKTEKFISEILQNATFQDLQIPLTIVATDFNTADSVYFSEGDVAKAIRASIAIPTIFQPLSYLDKLLADGGLSNPVPVSVVAAMGADLTIAVNLDRVYQENPIANLPPLSKIPLLAINILRHNLALYSISNADIIITPLNKLQIGLVGWKHIFDNNKVRQIIQEGEDAADRVIPDIKKQILEFQQRQLPLHKFFSFFRIR